MKMQFQYNDGGRQKAGFRGSTGDCATRAIAIATQKPYREVYDALNRLALQERPKRRKRSNSRTGVHRETVDRYLQIIGGWVWVPTMGIGVGCKVHLVQGELPECNRLIVRLSKHFTTVINGVIYDTYDPQRATVIVEDSKPRVSYRCVYGYWIEISK